ncbi:MAG: hypothetical protein NVSMB9_12660 [Isosphaeraceae bacterium]
MIPIRQARNFMRLASFRTTTVARTLPWFRLPKTYPIDVAIEFLRNVTEPSPDAYLYPAG